MSTSGSTRPEKSQTLVSWKEIAAFLGRAERTVKRWERVRGLPVHRVPGGERGGVFAYPDELRAWLLGDQGRAAQSPASAKTDQALVEPASSPSSQPAIPVAPELALSENSADPKTNSESDGFRRALPWMLVSAAILGTAIAVILATSGSSRAASSAWRIAGTPKAVHVPKPEAEQLYLHGRYHWSLRTADSLANSVDEYSQAIALDPTYAEPYAGLAESYELLPEYGHISQRDAYARAKVAAKRAMELNPDLAAGHRAEAFALFWDDWDVPGSDAEFRLALALAPMEAETHHWYATTLLSRSERAASIQQADEALRLGPTNPAIIADAAFIHATLNDNRAAGIRTLRELAKSDPGLVKPTRYLARLELDDGNYEGFLTDLRASANISRDLNEAAVADAAERGWAHGGKQGMLEAVREVQQAAFDRGTSSGFNLARTYLLLGKPNEALRYFNAAYKRNDFSLMGLEACEWSAGLKKNAGYAALLRQIRDRMRLPPEPPENSLPPSASKNLSLAASPVH